MGNTRSKAGGTYSRLLEKLQSSTGIQSSLPTSSPYRSTKQVIFVRHGNIELSLCILWEFSLQSDHVTTLSGQYKNVDGIDDDEQGLTALGQEQADLAGKRLAEILKVMFFCYVCVLAILEL